MGVGGRHPGLGRMANRKLGEAVEVDILAEYDFPKDMEVLDVEDLDEGLEEACL